MLWYKPETTGGAPKACCWQAGATLYLRNSDWRELLWSLHSPYFRFPVAVPFSQAKPAKSCFSVLFCFFDPPPSMRFKASGIC